MSKLGDLIVKLRLDGKDYQRGLRNAEAKTKGLAGNMGKVVGALKTGWMAVGVAAAAVGTQLIKSSNKWGDAWTRNMEGIKSAWQSFKTSVMSGDFKNMGANIKSSFQAGKEYANAMDGVFETENAIALQTSKSRVQLEAYRQDMMDTSKTVNERVEAGERYLAFLKKQADVEIALRKKVMDAAINRWKANSGVNSSNANVIDFFTNYTGAGSAAEKAHPVLAAAYENKNNDQTNGVVVQAILAYNNAVSAFTEENRRVIHSVTELRNSMDDLDTILEEVARDFEDIVLADDLEEIADTISFKDLDLSVDNSAISSFVDDWESKVARFQDIAAEFRDACIYGFVDGAQYMTDALFGLEKFNAGMLIASLLSPLADMAIKEGEILIAEGVGVEACKKALESLNGYAAIAAGTALVAIGAAAKSGLSALASRGASSAGSSSSPSAYGSVEDINTELTVTVTGRLSGSDILIAGQRAQKSLAR